MQFYNLAFWGIFLLLIGFALLARVILNLEFPVLKVIIGLFLILTGIRIMVGDFRLWPLRTADNEIFFRSAKIIPGRDMQPGYQVVFSQAAFDLSRIDPGEAGKRISMNSVFSGSTIYLPPGQPVIIQVDAVFSSVKMPGRNTPVLGRGHYKSENFDPENPHLSINVNIVFGSVVLMYRR
jgi:predicted membrane protein